MPQQQIGIYGQRRATTTHRQQMQQWFLVFLIAVVVSRNQIQGLKEGECPAIKSSSSLNCDKASSRSAPECTVDEDCPGYDKCCSNGCSFGCTQSLVSGCEQTRRQARVLNSLEPNCDRNGNFEPVQCATSRDDGTKCWCVDEFGFEIGGTRVVGRDAVNCTRSNPKCSAHQCRMLCPNGFDVDENGCSICSCRDICRNVKCPGQSTCEVVEVPCTNEPNCPPQPVCREGRTLDNVCSFGKPLIIPETGNPYLCGNGAGKPSCPPGFNCNVMDGNDYGVCCTRTMTLEKIGSCPVVTRAESDDTNCTETCRVDLDCPGTEKCCPSAGCGNTCSTAANLTLCLQQRQISLLLTSKEEDDKGYIPQCDENGQFITKQCSKNGKICWCVDLDGKASVTGIGPADSVICGNSVPNNNHKSLLAQPRGLRKTSSSPLETFNVNPCHVGTPLVDSITGEVQTCTSGGDGDCPASHTCVRAQVNSAGVCCVNQTVTEPTKPGICPFLSSESLCHNNESKSCQTDKECEGEMKCCGLGGSTCFGRAICADPLLNHNTASNAMLEEEIGDNFSMCRYLNSIGKKSHGVLKKYKMAFGIPKCEDNGEFEPVQCNGDESQCWCVDKYGMMTGQAEQYNDKNATELSLICNKQSKGDDICLGMTCRLNCDYGFVQNPSNGCSICECRSPCGNSSANLCGPDHICEMVDIDCATQICPALPYCLPKSLIVPTCPLNKQPYIDPILQEKMTCNPRARMLQCPDDHFCHEVDDDLGLCCPILEENSQELVAASRSFGDEKSSNNNIEDQQEAGDNSLDDTIVETPTDYTNPIECPEQFMATNNGGDCGFKCYNSTECGGNPAMKCCAHECGTTCIDVTRIPRSHCLMPKEVGFCKAALPKWHFNVETNSCEEFLYSGCGGNSNRFTTKEKCETLCPELSPCEQARELIARQRLSTEGTQKLIQVPECDTTGQWKMSCISEVGLCWCVDKFGMTIKDTIGRKGSVNCNIMKKNNRKSRLLATSTFTPRVCPESVPIHVCDPNLCAHKICLGDPSAVCRVNPCGGCSIEFSSVVTGQVVNCTQNLTKCEVEMQAVFNSKSFEIQRQVAAREVSMREFSDMSLQESDDVPLLREKRMKREIMVNDETNTCPQQPIQYLLNLLSGSCSDECTLDTDCPGSYKCCLAECGLRCLQPVISTILTPPPPPPPADPPQPIMMLLAPPQCKKDSGEYELIQSQNGVEYCVDEITGEPIASTITRGTIHNCNLTASKSGMVAEDEQVCSNRKQPMVCRDECLQAKCLAHPDAICIANPCDSCSVTFYSPSGEKLNCQHKCTQPVQVGPCRASIRRYFYNAESLKCDEFIYGGCQGNDNSFETLAECEFECGASRDICNDMVPMMPIASQQSCSVGETRWYYNPESATCEKSAACGIGNFVSFEQCQTSCPRQVLCPFIQDDGQIQICDRHEACDNVTFCMDNLEELICHVDPCTCKARLVDLNGSALEPCTRNEQKKIAQASGSKEEEGSLADSFERAKATPESGKLGTTVDLSIVGSLSTEIHPRRHDSAEAQVKSSVKKDAPVVDDVVMDPVTENKNNEAEVFSTERNEISDISRSISKESSEGTTQGAKEDFTIIPEVVTSTSTTTTTTTSTTTSTTTTTTTPATTTSTAAPETTTKTTTTTTPSTTTTTELPISSSSERNLLSPSQTSGEDERTTENQANQSLEDATEVETQEETTTMNLQNSRSTEFHEPSAKLNAANSDSIDADGEVIVVDEDPAAQDVITEQTAIATAETILEFQTIFFICILIVSAILILLGFFFARKKKNGSGGSENGTAKRPAPPTKKFEPLEFNSFVQLQQQIEFTKQQQNNSFKHDSTLTIPSDSYYDQLYQ